MTQPTPCHHSFPDPHPQPPTPPHPCRYCGTTYQEAKAAMTQPRRGVPVTPASELRTAAAKLRTLLADRQLTPGPWLSMDRGDRVLWDGPGAEDLPPRYVVDEPMSNGANADWIAAMHPGVGTALADWLEHEAAGHEAVQGVGDVTAELINVQLEQTEYGAQITHSTLPQALAVARAINGDQP
jgi:hypothetical protein